MNKLDNKFTEELKALLAKEEMEAEDVLKGALMLQRINPRNVTYRRWLSLAAQRPDYIKAHVVRELNNHLKYRLDGLTREEVVKLDNTVVPEAKRIIDEGEPQTDDDEDDEESQHVKRYGRRDDHDLLPVRIKDLWVDCAKLYNDIKRTFEELKSMEDQPSCQRYDKLQVLAAMDRRYFEQMAQYDAAKPVPQVQERTADSTFETSEVDNVPDAKSVSNARSYISKNIDKLRALVESGDNEAADALRSKIQERIDTLTAAAAPMGGELVAELSALGVNVATANEDKSDSEPVEAAGEV